MMTTMMMGRCSIDVVVMVTAETKVYLHVDGEVGEECESGGSKEEESQLGEKGTF